MFTTTQAFSGFSADDLQAARRRRPLGRTTRLADGCLARLRYLFALAGAGDRTVCET